jgi:hypothetical protein
VAAGASAGAGEEGKQGGGEPGRPGRTGRLGKLGQLEWGYHLVWVDNEHAVHRSLKMPRIDVRLFDPVEDAAILAKLATDEGGPTALFRDPCWMESSGTRCR